MIRCLGDSRIYPERIFGRDLSDIGWWSFQASCVFLSWMSILTRVFILTEPEKGTSPTTRWLRYNLTFGPQNEAVDIRSVIIMIELEIHSEDMFYV